MLALPCDIQASVIVVAGYGLLSIVGIPKSVLNSVLSAPVITRFVWVGLLVFLVSFKYYLTGTLVALLGLYISFNVRASYVFSNESVLEMYRAAQKNDPRFDEARELDLKMAKGTLTFDPARWQDPGRAPVPLLLFPPTQKQLTMIGGV